MNKIKISICVPAYKRTAYLQRLLDSILPQTFTNFEVIVSDDSDDDSVLQLIGRYSLKINIRYYKNERPLGTPANWNFAISKATGEWIKLVHDDDWFSSPKSLEVFARRTNAGNKFIFSAYNNCIEGSDKMEEMLFPSAAKKRIIKSPVTLLAKNVIGPPSITVIHRSIMEKYDEEMKWRVDIDFYIRVLSSERSYSYIDEPLMNIGISESQVTNDCLNVPSIELPEGFLLLKKYGSTPLKNILVYDAWWRILRNLGVTNQQQLEQFGQRDWPTVIVKMVGHLSKWPHRYLKIGIISKLAMACSYGINYSSTNF